MSFWPIVAAPTRHNITTVCANAQRYLTQFADYLGLLPLRLLLAWEFWESGYEKLHGENWFFAIQEAFPFPLNLLPPEWSWQAATWLELMGACCLALGLATRFSAFSLAVLTGIAIAAVHWPSEWASVAELWRGYAITDDGFGNYKLPLLFLAMLFPLIVFPAGRVAVDHYVWRYWQKRYMGAMPDA